MREVVRSLTGIVLLLGAAAAQQPPTPPPAKPEFLTGPARAAFLAEVEQHLSKVPRVVATFVQEKHLSLFEDVVTSEGLVVFETPDRLRWEIQSPFGSILVVAGDRVGKFEIVDGKPKKLELGRAGDVVAAVMGQIRGWFRGAFDQPGSPYRVQVARSPRPLVVLEPVDKTLQKGLERVELELTADLGAVATVTVRETGGDFTVMRYTNLLPPPPLPADCFDPAAPGALDRKALAEAAAKAAEAAKGAKGAGGR